MLGFNKKVLIIGYGSVSRCTLPIMLKHIKVPLENITVIDLEDKAAELKQYAPHGIKFFRQKIAPQNMGKILSQHLEKGGLLIDLAWNIDCGEIVTWCHEHEVLYVNTSVEVWDSFTERFTATPYQKSLYHRQMKLRELTKNWKDATTFVVDHGANPGLISHFAKQGAIDIARKLIKENKAKDPAKLEKLIDQRDFAGLGHELGIKVIHCSERDTQITDNPKKIDEFVGTWSIEGLREEGTAPAEMGWGTHEKTLTRLAHRPPTGPRNTGVRSYVPDYEIIGMVIRHGEAFGISDKWTLRKNGKVVYRPTVHYAYQPCDDTIMSLHELRGLNYEMQSKLRILQDHEITSGNDILGALLMGHGYNSGWTGSILSIEESRKLAPGQNATTIQVALGIITAAMWMIENPKKGFCLPDDLPHDFVLKVAKPYLGKFVSKAYDWTPLKNRKTYFKENPANKLDHQDPWQFKNFTFIA